MKKIIYFDTETTGIDPFRNGIWQLAYLIEIDGEIKSEGNIKMKPFESDEIEPSALKVGGITEKDFECFEPQEIAFKKFVAVLESYVDKYNRNDKFYPSGYNVIFDLNFVGEWFKKNGEKYGFGSFCNWRMIDPLPVFRWLDFAGLYHLPDYKLQTVCDAFKIELDAHDAISDIKATRELVKRIEKKIKEYGSK